MMLQRETELGGWFKIERGKCDAEGHPIEATREVVADWFPNLILDQGLDYVGGASNYLVACQVGTSSTAPANGQTGLQAFLVGTTTVTTTTTGNSGSSPYYGYRRLTFRFGQGVAAGNLSEVGVGLTSTTGNLFSRALILDGGGSPTTITVLGDEFLDVTYELRSYQKESDTNDTITISAVDYDTVTRGADVDDAANTTPGFGIAFNDQYSAYVTDGALQAITLEPTGTPTAYSSRALASYSNGNYYRDITFVWTLTPNAAVSALCVSALNLGVFQMSFASDPGANPIPMDNTKQLTFVCRVSWARKVLP